MEPLEELLVREQKRDKVNDARVSGVAEWLRERIANTVNPFGYRPDIKDQVELLKKFVTGKSEAKSNPTIPPPGNLKADTDLRKQLFRLYLGLGADEKVVRPATYKPGRAKDKGARYHEISPEFLQTLLGGDPYTELDRSLSTQQKGRGGSIPGLGMHTTERGFDPEQNSPYISYYDKWDLTSPGYQHRMLGLPVDWFNYPVEVYGRAYPKKK